MDGGRLSPNGGRRRRMGTGNGSWWDALASPWVPLHHTSDSRTGEAVVSREHMIPWYPLLPEDAEVFRANGDCLCDACGKPFRGHARYAYPHAPDALPWEISTVVLACDGKYLHL